MQLVFHVLKDLSLKPLVSFEDRHVICPGDLVQFVFHVLKDLPLEPLVSFADRHVTCTGYLAQMVLGVLRDLTLQFLFIPREPPHDMVTWSNL